MGLWVIAELILPAGGAPDPYVNREAVAATPLRRIAVTPLLGEGTAPLGVEATAGSRDHAYIGHEAPTADPGAGRPGAETREVVRLVDRARAGILIGVDHGAYILTPPGVGWRHEHETETNENGEQQKSLHCLPSLGRMCFSWKLCL